MSASSGGTEFPLEERFNALCEILGEIERDGCDPWSVNATTALCHARTIAEDVLAAWAVGVAGPVPNYQPILKEL